PDGERVMSTEQGYVTVMRPNGEDRQRVVLADGIYEPFAWSPDGLLVASTVRNPNARVMGEGWTSIAVIDVDSGLQRVATNNPRGTDYQPTWSPDGRSLAYVAGPGGIQVVKLDDLSVSILTEIREFDTMPAWSP
ncbi:MAG: hypothetical protein ABGY41_03730, partial [Candidatus Poribacteria bacterium]